MTPLNLYLAGGMMLLVTVFLLFSAYAEKSSSLRQKKWPVVPATVTRSEIIKGPLGDRGSEFRSSGFMWRFHIEYDYELNGNPYKGNMFTNKSEFDGIYDRSGNSVNSSPPDRLQAHLKKYQIGSKNNIHHSVNRPEWSYVEFEVRNTFFMWLIFFGTLSAIISMALIRLAILK